MKTFDYIRPATVADAVAAAAAPHAAYLASGTNLLDLMKLGVARPDRLIDITHIAGLDRIERLPDGGMRIGALVRNADLAHDPDFFRSYPAVAEALLSGASAQLRNAATVGGNLLQQTRCAYFHDPASACNRRAPGSGCDALQARTACMPCWAGARPASPFIPPTSACPWSRSMPSSRSKAGTGGERLRSRRCTACPATRPEHETALEPGDLITALRLPAQAAAFARHARYLKLRERTSYAFAVVAAAAALTLKNGKIGQARLALGGVAAKPWRARAAEEILAGESPGETVFRRAAEAALAEARPSGDNDFKIELARRIIVRTLGLAAAGTPERLPALPGSPFSSIPGAHRDE